MKPYTEPAQSSFGFLLPQSPDRSRSYAPCPCPHSHSNGLELAHVLSRPLPHSPSPRNSSLGIFSSLGAFAMRNGCSYMLLYPGSVLLLPHIQRWLPKNPEMSHQMHHDHLNASHSAAPHTVFLLVGIISILTGGPEMFRKCTKHRDSHQSQLTPQGDRAPMLQHPQKQTPCIAKDAAAATVGVGWSYSAPRHLIYLLPQCPMGPGLTCRMGTGTSNSGRALCIPSVPSSVKVSTKQAEQWLGSERFSCRGLINSS